jgi:hypothetical protein
LTNAAPLSISQPLSPNGSVEVQVVLSSIRDIQTKDPYNALQVAIKSSKGIFYFQTLLPLHVIFDETCAPSLYGFEQVWNSLEAQSLEFECEIPKDLESRLIRNGIMPIPGDSLNGEMRLIATNKIFIIVALLEKTESLASFTIKSTNSSVLPLFQESITGILS